MARSRNAFSKPRGYPFNGKAAAPMRVGAPVFWWTWSWGGCSKIQERSEVMSRATDSGRSQAKLAKTPLGSRLARHSTSPFGLWRVLIRSEGSDYPLFERPKIQFSNEGNRGGKRSRSCLPRPCVLELRV